MTRIVADCEWEVGGHSWLFYINLANKGCPPSLLKVVCKCYGRREEWREQKEGRKAKRKKWGRKEENTNTKELTFFKNSFWSYVVSLGHSHTQGKESFISLFLFSLALYIPLFKATSPFFIVRIRENCWSIFFVSFIKSYIEIFLWSPWFFDFYTVVLSPKFQEIRVG